MICSYKNLVKSKCHLNKIQIIKSTKTQSMKKAFTLLLTSLVFISVNGQDELKYRRSSLNMILLESENFPRKDFVVDAYYSHPFPDKYNKHDIENKTFEVDKLKLTDSEMIAAGFYKDTLTNPIKIAAAEKVANKLDQKLRYLDDEKTRAVIEPSEDQLTSAKISKFIEENKIAKQIASTWFNRQPDGTMDEGLILERGMYSASSAEIEAAKTGADDLQTLLYDIDLLGNTFIIFNKLKFYENEPVANAARVAAKLLADESFKEAPALKQKAYEAADLAYEKFKEGYTVIAISFLYQFDWNKEIAENFKFNYFDNPDKIGNWENDTLLKMKFIGLGKSSSIVTASIGKDDRSEDDLIKIAVDRNIDNVFSKLQKSYVVFRPVTPITSTEPITAKIGLKEGLEQNQKFEILEFQTDENGLPKLNAIGKVKIDKNFPIWDNRVGAEFEKINDEDGNENSTNNLQPYTTFSGGKKAIPGVHFLRLLK